MNLGVFNKVNLKVSAEEKGMYAEWTSLASLIHSSAQEGSSVLGKLSPGIGKEVAFQVVRQLASNLGIAQAAEPSTLTTDREVQWCMEVICFGLTLPLADHDTIRDCVNVYCEWLSALDPVPKISVPRPVCDDPNLYARKIIIHFQNLFRPRNNEGADAINRQAVLCHRVLRTLQSLAQTSHCMTRDTWECLLLFLLSVNDTLLAPPNLKDDVGDQLCERVLGVLFEVWLLACSKCFPSPPLWKTMRENCMKWRHHLALIEQWNRINLALTSRVIAFMYGPSFPELKISDEDAQLIPPDMSNDCIAQSWLRFLHCIGNPVNLCRPAVISQTDKFLQFAIGNEETVDPSQHPCLNNLPLIFLKAVKGFSCLVDAFLGIAQPYSWEENVSLGSWEKNKDQRSSLNEMHGSTPPTQRRLAKSFSAAPSTVTKGIPKSALTSFSSSRSSSVQNSAAVNSGPSSTSSLSSNTSFHQDWRNHLLAPNRPKCNSILHLFGEWLFEAAFIGTEQTFQLPGSSNDSNKRSSIIEDSSLPSGNSLELTPALMSENYESGRAEAIGALCRVFCAKKTNEEILTVYSARFYLALLHGLKPNANKECGETMALILLNSADLLKLDLDGVQVLIPALISALEIVLPEKDLRLKSNIVSKIELRRASINLLLSMLVLPLHFQNLPIRELIHSEGNQDRLITFAQLKPRLMNLLINALQVESDTYNTHMLLGGLLLSVQDSAMAELSDTFIQPRTNSESTSNLLSSASDATGVFSTNANSSSCVSGTTTTVTSASASPGFTTSVAAGYQSLPDDVVSHDLRALESSQPFDSAHALFVRATYLVCHRLISSWKTDLNVSLAALELLMGLARIHIRESDALECKRAVKWLCDYIIYQCWRPPPAHSKDLHSTIVAAFQCCAVWLVAHPYLLDDKDCLHTALEVAELGICGTKSIGKPGEPICMKDEKQLKPASMRVRESAEHLLSIIMEQVGYFPSECGPESLSSLLNEVSLLKHCNSWPGNRNEPDAAIHQFRYFVFENSTILALLEEPLGNDQDPQPTVTIIIRGPFGRYVWTMQLRHLPRHKSGSKYHGPTSGRPVPMQEPPAQPQVHQTYFPESVDRIPEFKVDSCIQSLDSILSLNPSKTEEHNQFNQLLDRQSSLETAFLTKDHFEFQQHDLVSECVPPKICHEFQTARLFLSHFGFILADESTEESSVPILTALDTSVPGFWSEIESLDRMSSRTFDTAHVFYVAAGQRSAEEIVANVTHESNVSPTFLKFLASLGWPVDVSLHPGWTGHVSTSWHFDAKKDDQNNQEKVNTISQHGGSIYNGEKQVLYWSDANSEIAFVVPSRCKNINKCESDSSYSGNSFKNWYEPGLTEETASKHRGSLEYEKQSNDTNRRRNAVRSQINNHLDTKIMIVWVESYEDHLQLPIEDLLHSMSTGFEGNNSTKNQDVLIIFLHELKSGLLRAHLKGPAGRVNLATPLVDGMILSGKVLGPLIRQTALNMARRRRLDCDTYQPPHVRRRLKIQDITHNYKKEMTCPELLTCLFKSC